MFIITGNNMRTKRVKILDTEDNKEDWVDYTVLYRTLRRGIEVRGLDSSGNIICQNIKLEDEMYKVLSPIYAKVSLLKLEKFKLRELIYNALQPYGFVDTLDDILLKSNGAIYLGKLGMLLKFTKTNKVRITILCKIKWDNAF